MDIDKKDLKKLRKQTGAGMSDCKDALQEAEGDYMQALEIVKEKGAAIAEKKSAEETGAGLLHSYIHQGRVGVLLELRAQTDFTLKAEPVEKLAQEIAMQIASMGPEDVEELKSQPYIKDEEKEVEEVIKEVMAEVGENIEISRFCRYEV